MLKFVWWILVFLIYVYLVVVIFLGDSLSWDLEWVKIFLIIKNEGKKYKYL